MARSQGIIAYNVLTLLNADSDATQSLQGVQTSGLIDGSNAWVGDKAAIYRFIAVSALTPDGDKVINGLGGGQWVLSEGGSDPVNVYTLADLPDPVTGVITLAAGTAYRFIGLLDLGTNRIVMGAGTRIEGVGFAQILSNNANPTITGAAGEICSVVNLAVYNAAGNAFAWVAGGDGSQCTLRDCIFTGQVGAVLVGGDADDYIFIRDCDFHGNQVDGAVVDGIWGAVTFEGCRFFANNAGAEALLIASNASEISLMALTGCEFVHVSGHYGIAQSHADAVLEGRLTGNLFHGAGSPVDANVATTEWVAVNNCGLVDF